MSSGVFNPNDPANGASGATGSGFDVWDGTYTTDSTMAPHNGHQTTYTTPEPTMVDTVTYAIDQLPKLSNAQLKTLQEQLYKAGYVPQNAVTGAYNAYTKDGYEKFLEDAAGEGLRSGPITPDQYMAKILGPGGAGTGASHSSTSTSTSIASSQDARQLALTTFQSLLGRRPSQHEMDAFYTALTAYDRAHPSVSTTQETTGGASADTATNSTTTSTGGVNDQSFAQQYVDQNYGGQEGQHDALHYFDLVNQVLTGPPPGVQHAA